MKISKKVGYSLLVVVGIILWWVETAYFGWNTKAESTIEGMLDSTAWIFIIWGVIGHISTNLTIQKVTNISTDKVTLTDKLGG